ncbi:unnamed protein product [Adineta ricciae]|uniref:G-protein coupled receptors family 1 profile domain-containing protein n=1 Tax=Adineta ricciae TaxID=249248 RepID=A0A815C6L0_ADIRI|nr:unnamed protein product [Adineta ricciae]
MSSDEILRLNFIAQTIVIYAGSSMFICGILGNIVNIFLFTFHRQFNSLSISRFLLFSFFGSQLNLLSAFLPQLISRITGNDPLVKSEILCKLRWFFGPVTGTVALHGICLASVNHYLLSLRNIRYHRWITQRRSYFICLFVLFYSVLFISPNLIYFTHWINISNITTCDIINPIAASYNVYIGLVIYSLIPIFVLSILSSLIWFNIRKIIIRGNGIEQTITGLLVGQVVMVLFTTIAFILFV